MGFCLREKGRAFCQKTAVATDETPLLQLVSGINAI
jgi:hypothetical protein